MQTLQPRLACTAELHAKLHREYLAGASAVEPTDLVTREQTGAGMTCSELLSRLRPHMLSYYAGGRTDRYCDLKGLCLRLYQSASACSREPEAGFESLDLAGYGALLLESALSGAFNSFAHSLVRFVVARVTSSSSYEDVLCGVALSSLFPASLD